MVDVGVIDDPVAAAVALDPLRLRILAALADPGSATTVAAELGSTRQKVNYHLRALEDAKLVELVEERPRRGVTERVVRATARSYVLSPAVLGPSGVTLERTSRLSSDYLLAVAARLLREVAHLATRARTARRPLATLTIDTEIRFASAAERAAFAAELSASVRALTARYHDETRPGGRWHRVVVAAHPIAAPAPGSAEPEPQATRGTSP